MPACSAGLLADAGLSDVHVSELPVPLRAGSFDEWWERTSALAGPLTKILSAREARQAPARAARGSVRPYMTRPGRDPGLTLVASGRR